MSQQESEFIRKLKITLISVLGPLVITGLILTGVNLQRINSNEKHIAALEQTRVSKDILLLYVNDLREIMDLLRQDMNSEDQAVKKQIDDVNTRLDLLMRDLYEVKKRGFPEGYKF